MTVNLQVVAGLVSGTERRHSYSFFLAMGHGPTHLSVEERNCDKVCKRK